MLSLDSNRWATLKHAYGDASDIPGLLVQLKSLPSSQGNQEPWYSIWSALAHQGDVYSASFAAVPHVVASIEIDPLRIDFSYFHFPAWVEICRHKQGLTVPDDLSDAYFDALAKLPGLVAEASHQDWDAGMLSCALAAIAAAKGHCAVAEAVLELNSEVARDFLEWYLDL